MSISRRGLMFVLSSPSGAGKTTLSRKLLERHGDGSLAMSVSVTTRPPRPGEVEGRDYFFISPKEHERMAAGGELLEHAQVFDYRYGTPAKFVREKIERGVDVLFDIDWQGTRQLCEKAPADVASVFILPPSMEELRRRLQTRAQDSEDVVNKRMAKAKGEISHWQEYDYVLINRDLEDTLRQVDIILSAERLKRARQAGLKGFVETL